MSPREITAAAAARLDAASAGASAGAPVGRAPGGADPSAAADPRLRAAPPPARRPGEEAGPSRSWRALTLLAAVLLLSGVATTQQREALDDRWLTGLLMAVYAALLGAAVCALVVRRTRAARLLDAAVLGVGLLRTALLWSATVGPGHPLYGADEGALVTRAARAFAAGRRVYGVSWGDLPRIFPQVPFTHMADGSQAHSFGYPPLSVELTAAVRGMLPLPSWFPVAGALAVAGLAASAVLMAVLLPAPLRPLAALICLGLPWALEYARQGYPIFVALPFLVAAFAGWSRTGAGGRLGTGGVLRGLCLGLACSAHQLAWFAAPFLVIGILLQRLGEPGLPRRRALLVGLRYAGCAAAAFLAANLPPLVQAPGAWLSGLLTPFTQHAVPAGLGAVDISLFLTSGSGALGWYGQAALLFTLALLAAFAAFPRRLGPAAAALPWLGFWLSTRSPETYFVLLLPVWATALATVPVRDFARAWQWRHGRATVAVSRIRRATPAAVLAAAAAGAAFVAVTVPPPLAMHVISAPGTRTAISALTVDVTNRSAHPLAPHFTLSDSYVLRWDWRVVSGPAVLAPGQRAVYRLRPTGPGRNPRNPAGPTYLRVLSDDPETLSSVQVPQAS